MEALLARPQVTTVHENTRYRPFLDESLALIRQPEVEVEGDFGGARTVIPVLDSGVDYTHSFFGCTAPGPGCAVVALHETEPDGLIDDFGHGTLVSAIAAAVAQDAQLAVADVFDGFDIPLEHVNDAINWALDQIVAQNWNIVAMNISWGDPTPRHTTHCAASSFLGATALADAIAAGIQPVAATGNSSHSGGIFFDGVADPACLEEVVSVGAVLDVGAQSYGNFFTCTDDTTAADEVACFSQTADFLSLLAPGVRITSGGAPSYPAPFGTSFAAPHVSGAWAVMRSALPTFNDVRILQRLQNTGEPILDDRVSPSRETSRVDLFAALDGDDNGMIEDEDDDSILDEDDNCRVVPNPLQDAAIQDPSLTASRGAACLAGDQTQDGRINVSDIIAINEAIFDQTLVTEFCDANEDGLCNIEDILAVNNAILEVCTTVSALYPEAQPGLTVPDPCD